VPPEAPTPPDHTSPPCQTWTPASRRLVGYNELDTDLRNDLLIAQKAGN